MNTTVKLLEKYQHDQYRIVWEENGVDQESIAKHVLVASGMFNEEYIPNDLPGIDKFNGDILHSRNYKDNLSYDNKRVLVVGGSFTGV